MRNLAIHNMTSGFNDFEPVHMFNRQRRLGNRITYCIIATSF